MIGGKCPLCDGPVSGGRCTLCGMPYRKDEILYHLNENSRDHYKHATENVREIMRGKSGIPTGAGAVGKNASKEDIRAYQEKMRQEAVKRMTTVKNTVHTGKKTVSKKQWKKGVDASETKTKKTGKGKWIFWLILILIFIVPSIVNFVEEKYQEYVYQKEWEELYSETDAYEETYFQEWSDEQSRGYKFLAGKGSAEVGTEIEPGSYTVFGTSEENDITLVIKDGDDKSEYYITPEDFLPTVILKDGDILYFKDAVHDNDGIFLDQPVDKK